MKPRVKGVSLVEILNAIAVDAIITLALTFLFVGSNRAFLGNRASAGLTEDVRNAITTLEFVFSRWGTGVPCRDNNCTIESPPPPCSSYPPYDPQCITLTSSSVEFYANIYGYGFVTTATNTTASIISCRLDSSSRDNYYYI